jgi:hypothetical protein
MGDREDYDALVKDTPAFRAYLDGMIAEYPELLPAKLDKGIVWVRLIATTGTDHPPHPAQK